ncbi:hypothetical protein BHE74_00049751 [Ensete ventricosum]|nr:hypothetical protein GW17_00054750 [Ensete ventricosum]RWW44475.1 hypothetical protein BHE74_00049751 [Ensete ventricosum]
MPTEFPQCDDHLFPAMTSNSEKTQQRVNDDNPSCVVHGSERRCDQNLELRPLAGVSSRDDRKLNWRRRNI